MKKITIIVLVLLAIGLGYWLISPLFINIKLDEPLPEGVGQVVNDSVSGNGGADAVVNTDPNTNKEGVISDNNPGPIVGSTGGGNTTSIKSPEQKEPTISEQSTAPVPLVGTSGHPANGTARIITVGGKSYVRYENFKTINGPDIFVYLAKDLGAKEFVNLGKVKATEGNVNYEIPADVNPADYPYVLIWCRAFGVLFNSAKVY